VLLVVLTGCASQPPPQNPSPTTLRIIGSDTMLPLVRAWSETFMREHPGVIIETAGGGSGHGIQELIAGNADLCSASRPLRPGELQQLLDRRGFLGMSVLTGKDALSIYLHPSNPVHNLSMQQLADILGGRIRNWREVGGEDRAIEVIGRQPNSGTFGFMRENVLAGGDYTAEARAMPTTHAVVQAVLQSPGALGYGGMAYGDEVVHCSIDTRKPTRANVRNGSYPLSRYLYLYAAGPLEGIARMFVDWVLSREGQIIVEDVGYIPLFDVE
jgi:phosphate transport system substrate-binding protein